MPLISCIECGSKFSDYASACPKCGCPTDISLGKDNVSINKVKDHNEVDDFSDNKEEKINHHQIEKYENFNKIDSVFDATSQIDTASTEASYEKHKTKRPNNRVKVVISLLIMSIVSFLVYYKFSYDRKAEEYFHQEYNAQLDKDRVINSRMDRILLSLDNQTSYWNIELSEWSWWYSINNINFRENTNEFCVVVGLSFNKDTKSPYYIDNSYDDGLFNFSLEQLKINSQIRFRADYISECYDAYISYDIKNNSPNLIINNGDTYYFLTKFNRNQLNERHLLQYGNHSIVNLMLNE